MLELFNKEGKSAGLFRGLYKKERGRSPFPSPIKTKSDEKNDVLLFNEQLKELVKLR